MVGVLTPSGSLVSRFVGLAALGFWQLPDTFVQSVQGEFSTPGGVHPSAWASPEEEVTSKRSHRSELCVAAGVWRGILVEADNLTAEHHRHHAEPQLASRHRSWDCYGGAPVMTARASACSETFKCDLVCLYHERTAREVVGTIQQEWRRLGLIRTCVGLGLGWVYKRHGISVPTPMFNSTRHPS